MKRHFAQIHIESNYHEKSMPLLIISNHISWWDGFWAMYLNIKVFKKLFHFMMLEEQLRKYWFFNYTGGFSVSKNSRSVIESLKYTSDLLNNKKNMVLIFPQGKIQSMHSQQFEFEKGIERILKNKENKIQVLFVNNMLDYFSKAKPGFYSYIEEYNQEFNKETIEEKYIEFYNKCLEKQKTLAN